MRNKIVAKTTRVYDFYYVDHKCDLQFNIVDLLYFSFTSLYFLMVFFFIIFIGTFLTSTCMKNETIRKDGMELKSKLSLRGIGQLTVYVVFNGVSAVQ